MTSSALSLTQLIQKYKQEIQQRIKEKKKKAQDLMLELIAFRTLIERNRDMEGKTGPLPEKSTIQVRSSDLFDNKVIATIYICTIIYSQQF